MARARLRLEFSLDLQIQLCQPGGYRVRVSLRPRLRVACLEAAAAADPVGEFDVVLRLLPMTAVLPSPFAFPAKGIDTVCDWAYQWRPALRDRFQPGQCPEGVDLDSEGPVPVLPFARSTYRDAAAIVVASSQTYAEFAALPRQVVLCP